MKILWFSNIRLTDSSMYGSGTWIVGMNDLLSFYYPDIQIANVTISNVESIHEEKVRGRHQWILPCKILATDIDVFSKIINSYNPDVIQIWGTEFFWASIPFEHICPGIPIILDMQGFYSSILDVLFGDLTIKERIKCFSLKEFLCPRSSLLGIFKRLKKLAQREEEAIRKHNIISVQSNWVKGNVCLLNPQATIYETRIALRSQFFCSKKWSSNAMEPYTIFSTASMIEPTKGGYTLLKAFCEVKRIVPKAKLILAGATQSGFRKSGYMRLMEDYIRSNCLSDSISFVGSLDTNSLINAYLHSNVFVNPSYVESYSLILAESTYLGVPTVATYAGAMGELGDSDSVLYFSKYDYRACASKIISILTNCCFAEKLSTNASNFSTEKHHPETVARTQFSIYNSIIKQANK